MTMNDDYDGVEAVQRNHRRNGGGICPNSNKRKAITKMVESNLVPIQKRKAASVYLPDELIIFNILTRLPAKSLSRFNCVSKSWCATVDGQDPKFIAAHSIESNRKPPLVLGFFHVHEKGEEDKQKKKKQAQPSSYYNFISIDQNFDYKFSNYLCFRSAKRAANSYVVGYCNGLFCIRSSSGFEITNLSTRQVLLLPPPPLLPQALLRIKRYGFGFDPLNTEYKIMQFVDGRRCLVFTLGAGGTNLSWREIPVSTEVSNRLNYGYSHPRGTSFCTDPKNALYSTGCLHWLLIYPHVTVLSFDVHTEQFLLIPAPKKFPEFAEPPERYFLLVFRDRPCCGFQKGFQKRGCGFLKGSRQLGVSYQINLFCLSNDPFTHPVSPYEPKWEEQTIPIPRVFQPKTTLIGLTSHLDQFVVYYYDKVKLIMFYHPHAKHHTFVIFPPTFVAFPPRMRSDLLPEPMFIYHTENLISLKPFVSSGTGADQLGYANQELITGV